MPNERHCVALRQPLAAQIATHHHDELRSAREAFRIVRANTSA